MPNSITDLLFLFSRLLSRFLRHFFLGSFYSFLRSLHSFLGSFFNYFLFRCLHYFLGLLPCLAGRQVHHFFSSFLGRFFSSWFCFCSGCFFLSCIIRTHLVQR